jgi:hypothetical protein
MDDIKYNNAVAAIRADLLETAREMKLDVEWCSKNTLTEEYVKTLHAEIAEYMLNGSW